MAEQWEWDEYGLIAKVGAQYERVVWIELVDNVGAFKRRPCLKAQLKALPDLLAACEAIKGIIFDANIFIRAVNGDFTDWDAAQAKIIAAIARAKGAA